MKKYLLLTILILSALLLLSCRKDEEAPAAAAETVIPTVTEQLSEYKIVYPECMGTYIELFTVERYSAVRLQSMIEEYYGVTLEVINDSEAQGGKEILIGSADASVSDGYTLTKSGESISVCAGGIYSYSKAFSALMDAVCDGIPESLDISGSAELGMDTEKEFVYINTEEGVEPSEYAIGSLTINGTDISAYRIIYHVWGSPLEPHYGLNEQYAAEQLQKYIRFATGVELPIETDETAPCDYEIVVGITNREGDVIEAVDRTVYGEETTLIRNEGTRLLISGAQRRGTIYAAYSFLEKYMGVRFFAEDCEIVYKAESVDISGISDEYTPTMEYRDTNQKSMHPAEYSSKRKINSSFCRTMNYKQGGTFTFAGEFSHTMGTMLQLDNAPGFAQPCFTDEATFEKALTKIRTLLERNTDCKVVSVTQNDAYGYCACASCSRIIKEEGSTTAPLIRFINRLADGIRDDFPDAKLMTLAYMFSLQPPKTAPADNVVIMYCPIESCCSCALNDPDCMTNRSYAEYLEGWLALTDNVYIWYYTVEFTQDDTLPFMNLDALYDTYKYFHSIGVKGMFNEGWMNNEGNEFGTMRAYLLSRLMWEPDMTREEYENAINEFIDAYYGEGSEYIKEYLYALRATSEHKHFAQYSSVDGMFDVANLSELTSELDLWWQALDSYEYSSDTVKSHVARLSRGYDKLCTAMR